MLTRAYTTFTLKSVDDDQRVIEGIASTPTPDRVGDIVEPEGGRYKLPMPLLWQHRSDEPIGHVIAVKASKKGISIRAQIAKGVLPRIDDAWALIKAGLVRGLSIGFKPLETEAIVSSTSLAQHYKQWEWLELSAVTVPAHQDASILTIKDLDRASRAPLVTKPGPGHVHSEKWHRCWEKVQEQGHDEQSAAAICTAVLGDESFDKAAIGHHTPGATGSHVVRLRDGTSAMTKKTVREQIEGFEAKRGATQARMTEIMSKAAEDGRTLDEAEKEEYDSAETEIGEIDAHLKRLAILEKAQIATATPVAAATPTQATASRGTAASVVSVKANRPPGVGFARYVKCKVVSYKDHLAVGEVAKQMYPGDDELRDFISKAAVPAGTTADAVWASPLVYATNLVSEFIEFMRPKTIIGQFGQGGIPALRGVPFNVRIPEQTSAGHAWWVGQGRPKPLTSFAFTSVSMAWAKVAAISVITEELARFSSPSAEMLVRDALTAALVERLDIDFIDPAHGSTANVSPASITNGLVPLSSAGTSASNAITDIQTLLANFLETNVDPSNLVLIMPNTLSMALSLFITTNGVRQFPDANMRGGSVLGIPIIASQYAANASGGGNLVIAVAADQIFLADDGGVTVDASREASLEMLDNPTNNSATATATTSVSMWQTNSIALRAERFINWSKRNTNAVVYMDDVNWGAVGSPPELGR